jgi:hypothetical protein
MDRHSELIRIATTRALAEVEVWRLDAIYRRLVQELAQDVPPRPPSSARDTLDRVLEARAKEAQDQMARQSSGVVVGRIWGAGTPVDRPAIELVTGLHAERQADVLVEPQDDMARMVAAIRSSTKTITA